MYVLAELLDYSSYLTQTVNCLAIALLAYGLRNRRRPAVHMPIMKTCFAIDFANLLLVETLNWAKRGKGATVQGIEGIRELDGLLIFHIAVSLLFLIGYAVALVTGKRLHGGKQESRRAHKINAAVFIFNRLASFVTSFFVQV